MENGAVDTLPLSISPRSTLGWKDDGAYESADLESTKYKPVLGPSHTRSKSLVGLSSSSVTPDGPKTPSLQLEAVVESSPTPCNSFVGTPRGPTTPSLQLERRVCRSLSSPLDANRRVVRGSLVIPESPGGTDGASSPPVQQSYTLNRPSTPRVRAVQLENANERRRGAPTSQSWEPVWGQDRPLPTRDDLVSSPADDTCSGHSSSSNAATSAREQTAPLSNRMQFVSSLNEELLSIKSCMKRAIDLGKKVQHYGALEVSQLRGDKANADAATEKTLQLNRELEEQVVTLRDEVQRLQWERELEVLSMRNQIQELEMERNTVTKAAREEKKKLEKVQSEVDSVLSVVLKEKMALESEREAHSLALLNEKKKSQTMRKARDAAVKALEEGTKKLEVERDAMLLAMRDLTSRLDFERDANLRSIRRTSMEMAAMISGSRLGSSRRQSLSANDGGSARSRPLSRQNSMQFVIE